jgi:DNA polymerase III delta prime subunit
MSLVYSTETARFLMQAIENLPHGILLDGPEGDGLFSLASHLAGVNLAGVIVPSERNVTDDRQKGTIKVAQIRELYEQARGKTAHRQIFIIDDADKMGLTAQNALLKLLEEPAENIHFILTAHHAYKLLPTIISRVQRTYITPISLEATKELLKELGVTDARKQQQLLFVAEGLPAEAARLAGDNRLFSERVQYVTDARTLLQGTLTDKIKVIGSYHANRAAALQLISSAETILSRNITSQPTSDAITLADSLASAYDRIAANGNIKLQLLAVVV